MRAFLGYWRLQGCPLSSLASLTTSPASFASTFSSATPVSFFTHLRILCLASSILEAREFEWESQLRFYWDREPDELNVRQCTGTFGYGYEYMGLNGRLVITPLTDRIYLTLTQVIGDQALMAVVQLWPCVFPKYGCGDCDSDRAEQGLPQNSCPLETTEYDLT